MWVLLVCLGPMTWSYFRQPTWLGKDGALRGAITGRYRGFHERQWMGCAADGRTIANPFPASQRLLPTADSAFLA